MYSCRRLVQPEMNLLLTLLLVVVMVLVSMQWVCSQYLKPMLQKRSRSLKWHQLWMQLLMRLPVQKT
jgi:hypothetical protein